MMRGNHFLKKYASHGITVLLTIAFFASVYTAFAVNYVTPGLTLDPGADFPVLCADPLNDCTTEVLRIGNPIGGATSGSIPFVDASGNLAEDNAALFWDETNGRLGIGTNAPQYSLDLAAVSVAATIVEDNTSVAGLEDLTPGGSYTGVITDSYCVVLNDDVTVPNTFDWYDSSCGNFVATLSITAGVAQTLSNGVTITFATDSGHTSGDVWFINLTPAVYSGDVNFGGNIYKGGNLWSGAIGGIVDNATATIVPFVDSNGLLAEDTSFTYDSTTTRLSANTFNIPNTSSSSVGVIQKNGTRFLHAYGTNNTFLGQSAGNFSLTTASAISNTAVGSSALSALTTGNENVAVGRQALVSNTTGQDNVAVGMNALVFNVVGDSNVAVGRLALQRNTASNNVGVGSGSFQLKGAGDGNIGIGSNSLFGASTNYSATYNIGIGSSAFLNIDTGADYNIAIGESAGAGGPLTGDFNIFMGRGSGDSTTTGERNIILGTDAASALNSGSLNTIIGDSAGLTLTTGSGNILLGEGVDVPTATTSDFLNIGDTIFGDLVLGQIGIMNSSPAYRLDIDTSTTTAASIGSAVFIGGGVDDLTSGGTYSGLTTNSFFVVIDSTGGTDTFMWFDANAEYAGAALVPITGGAQTLASGVTVTFASTTGHVGGEMWQIDVTPTTTTHEGDINIGGGLYIKGNLFLHNSGTENSFFGAGAGNLALTGLGGNVGIGNGVMASATTASRNTAIGAFAGGNITTGTFNTLFGYAAGGALQGGTNNIVIGDNTGTSMINASNSILIGSGVDNALDTSNYLSIGDALFGDFSTDNIGIGDSTPDFRLDVEQTTDGVVATFADNDNNCTIDPDIVGGISCTSDVRRKENVVTLDSALPDIRKLRTVSYDFIGDEDSSSIGFIAQEVEDIYPSLIVKNPNGYLTLSYAGLTPMLTRAIQELDIQITDISNLTGEAGMNLVDRLRNWLADAANGIEQIFTKRITTEELCVEDVCVTRDQFLQLLENADITTPTDGETPDPTGDNTPEENIETGDGDVETLTTDGGPIEEEPLPDSELIEEPVDETEEPTPPEPPQDEPTFDTEPTEPAL